MTAPTIASRPAAPAKPPAEILRLLVAGKTAQQAGDLTGWPRHRVVVLIQSTPGWLLDPDKDTVYDPSAPGMAARLPDGVTPAPPRPVEQPATPAPDGIEALLRRAEGLDDKAVTRELTKVLEGIARLRGLVTTVRERQRAESAVADLERQLAAARARAKELGTRRKTPADQAAADGPTTKEIRTWAAKVGIDCPARGKIPASVREAYEAREDA